MSIAENLRDYEVVSVDTFVDNITQELSRQSWAKAGDGVKGSIRGLLGAMKGFTEAQNMGQFVVMEAGRQIFIKSFRSLQRHSLSAKGEVCAFAAICSVSLSDTKKDSL